MIAVLLSGSETWRVIRAGENKLDTFQHLCLKRILKIYWPIKVSYEVVRRKPNVELVRTQVKRIVTVVVHRSCYYRCRKKLFHVPPSRTWVPEGKRKRGSPREVRMRRTVEKERKEFGVGSLAEAPIVAWDTDS